MLFAPPTLTRVRPVVSDASKKQNPHLLQPASVARKSTSSRTNASSSTSQYTSRTAGNSQDSNQSAPEAGSTGATTDALQPPPMARLKKALSMQSLRRRV
ncbi:hypothetical protein BDZ85DRAFT_286089 [Elsinoe ampelina]|uniref:Uncharacterized protein n=1 Tax=Elsinoe ampelina TaxID=302913 RepID=A0A6A6FZP5_9PEZI|nr:hypothetical protein BDZ85DRAFT_286089 [Elsinoe ampelina]